MRVYVLLILVSISPGFLFSQVSVQDKFIVNERGYYEASNATITVFDDFYPEGHQGGITLIQCGKRLAANGDVRLEDAPGQWSPVPKFGNKEIDRVKGTITVRLWFPDSSKNRKGFNPIEYPDVTFRYRIVTIPDGHSIRIRVTLEDSLPKIWRDKVGFNLEIFPGEYFGEAFLMDTVAGIFPRQFNGPVVRTLGKELRIVPLAQGKRLIVAPGNNTKQFSISSLRNTLTLLDGRAFHNNGWFVVRSTFGSAPVIEWVLTPTIQPGWRSTPVIQVSQVGFHPLQPKFAVVELDARTTTYQSLELVRIDGESPLPNVNEIVVKKDTVPNVWGDFLRSKYLRFDFSEIENEGLYKIRYGTISSHTFPIRKDIYETIWQPTLHTFLPVQMCHMRVEDRYKVWHGLCHMDDARMAPCNHIHFDGYQQGNTTLTRFQPGDHVPGLNEGGWHDAGDYDLRIESQAETVYKLALSFELFPNEYDETTIDQKRKLVVLHQPDGIPDFLQQIEHGVLSIVNAYDSMGRLYRGIICPTLKQYVHLGDAATMTDNLVYKVRSYDPILQKPLPEDDRWVFTEHNPQRELYVAQCLAAASRVLRTSNSQLAAKCLRVAEKLFWESDSSAPVAKYCVAAELLMTTGKPEYKSYVLDHFNLLETNLPSCLEIVGRVVNALGEPTLRQRMEPIVQKVQEYFEEERTRNPYNVPYHPRIWGAGWEIQSIAVKKYLLALGFPNTFDRTSIFYALNFLFGCHPGENTASFVSGVGVNSVTVAYGVNRDEWSYIPGGIVSGTALIRPDVPELKVWPYLWQQSEYVLGGGTGDFLFLMLAAEAEMKKLK
ncbi:MAG: glycoside hydrolase family 9 protein [Bacteroidetes bacterium]|nr:glycoside hydrolase family 9 protein [Bacteroidota bacterium]